MTDIIMKLSDERPSITITPNPSRVIVRVAGRIIADSGRVLTLRESERPPVHYFPREDVDMDLLEASNHRSYCPYRGEASYFSVPVGGTRSVDAAWTYEAPSEVVAGIRGYIAFHPGRVDCLDEWEASAR